MVRTATRDYPLLLDRAWRPDRGHGHFMFAGRLVPIHSDQSQPLRNFKGAPIRILDECIVT